MYNVYKYKIVYTIPSIKVYIKIVSRPHYNLSWASYQIEIVIT